METTLQIGRKAPDFLLRDLDGHPHALNHHLGRVVVINFWSAECPWSKRADDEIAAFRKGWEGRVSWIYIAPNANESLEEIRTEAEKRNLPLVLCDPERQVTGLYGAETTPHIFIIDSAGILQYQGAYDDISFRQKQPTINYLSAALEAVLAGALPEIVETPSSGCTIVYYPKD